MKIITWNVNGLRAVLRKQALAWVWNQDPDVLCLQEVKARPEQLTVEQRGSLPMPHVWNPAQQPGYSGVTTFYKEAPLEIRLRHVAVISSHTALLLHHTVSRW